jgi:signal peptidase II
MKGQPTRAWLTMFFLLAILGAAADILTKDVISGTLSDEQRIPAVQRHQEIVPGYLSLVTNTPLNKGALFSLGADFKDASNIVFIVISSLAILGIIGWAIWPHGHRSWIYRVTLSLILAGAFGNCYDRLLYGGVRDWIWFYIQGANGQLIFNWPVFNLADCFLVCSAIVLVVHGLFFAPKSQPAVAQTA